MGKHVVIIEDNPDEQNLMARVLRNHDLQPNVTMLNDGVEALDWFKLTTVVPDLVLVDIKLPRIDGIEVVKRMKENPRYATVPFVMLTTSTMESDILDAHRAGAASYLVKTIDGHPAEWGREVKGAITYWLSMNTTLKSTWAA